MPVYTIWILFCAVLVFMMQIGFALLECGFIDARNAASVVFKNMMDLCVGAIAYLTIGSLIMWGSSPVFPGFQQSVGDLAGDANPYAWILYHTAFAATATTIVSGAVAGRMKLSSYLFLTVVMTGVIYPVVGRYVWNSDLGIVDLAGSLVVHSVGGAAALAATLLIGKRKHRPPSHNVILSVAGALFLWVGWFGFNMGSVTGDMWVEVSGWVGINTLIAACFGGIITFLLTKWKGLPVVSTTVNGVLGGLVAITANAHISHPVVSAIIGSLAGLVIVWWATVEFKRGIFTKYIDDAVGAIPVHGLCGILGGFFVVICAMLPLDIMGAGIAFHGWPSQQQNANMFVCVYWLPQLLAVILIPCSVFIITMLVLKLIKSLNFDLIVPEKIQEVGLDGEELYQNAYNLEIVPLSHHEFLYLFERSIERKEIHQFSFDKDAESKDQGKALVQSPFSLRLSIWLHDIIVNLELLEKSYGGGRHFDETVRPLADKVRESALELREYGIRSSTQHKRERFEYCFKNLMLNLEEMTNTLRRQASIESSGFDIIADIKKQAASEVESRVGEMGKGLIESARNEMRIIEKRVEAAEAIIRTLRDRVMGG